MPISRTATFVVAYAQQSAYAKNPLDIDLAYYLGEAGIGYRGFTGLAGYEVLQGDGAMGFHTAGELIRTFERQ